MAIFRRAKRREHPRAAIQIPDDAFAQPTPEEIAGNESYWSGYEIGEKCSAALPSPEGSGDYDTYRGWIDPYLLPPAAPSGWVNNMAVGYNNAMLDGANWLWTYDPKSPHNVPS
jgi:hypothetical protein